MRQLCNIFISQPLGPDISKDAEIDSAQDLGTPDICCKQECIVDIEQAYSTG